MGIAKSNLDEDEASKMIQKIMPTPGYLTAKIVAQENLLPYRIITGKEVWISLT